MEWGIKKRLKERGEELKQEGDKLFQNFQKNPSVQNKERWKENKKVLEDLEKIEVTKKYLFVKNDFHVNSINNTKRLASYLKKKKGRNMVKKLKDENGQIKTKEEDLREIMASYYEKLYANKETEMSEGVVVRKLDPQDQIGLNKTITSKEIEEVINNLKPNSSPGPDGFTSNFYKIFQPEITPNLEILFNEILKNRTIPETWKRSEIITILKPNKDESDPNSYRPITLCNVDYKIFTKLLANRLTDIIPKLIGEDQYGFIKNRRLADPIRNILNVINQATREKEKLLLLKLDVYKAFDTVNHHYLQQVCEEYNLGREFCEVIKELYKDNLAQLLINGTRTRIIKINSGTKQGCPLSPILFALAIEPLANFIREDDKIKGFKIARELIKINLFADDAMVLMGSPMESIKEVIQTVKKFENLSGLAINIQKSEILHKNLS
uniref:Reverse transcriptase domain-containing protein n=1 Tax=Anolis carolinensis TaxID=28377 RepID=A0A803TVG9_ANOCA